MRRFNPLVPAPSQTFLRQAVGLLQGECTKVSAQSALISGHAMQALERNSARPPLRIASSVDSTVALTSLLSRESSASPRWQPPPPPPPLGAGPSALSSATVSEAAVPEVDRPSHVLALSESLINVEGVAGAAEGAAGAEGAYVAGAANGAGAADALAACASSVAEPTTTRRAMSDAEARRAAAAGTSGTGGSGTTTVALSLEDDAIDAGLMAGSDAGCRGCLPWRRRGTPQPAHGTAAPATPQSPLPPRTPTAATAAAVDASARGHTDAASADPLPTPLAKALAAAAPSTHGRAPDGPSDGAAGATAAAAAPSEEAPEWRIVAGAEADHPAAAAPPAPASASGAGGGLVMPPLRLNSLSQLPPPEPDLPTHRGVRLPAACACACACACAARVNARANAHANARANARAHAPEYVIRRHACAKRAHVPSGGARACAHPCIRAWACVWPASRALTCVCALPPSPPSPARPPVRRSHSVRRRCLRQGRISSLSPSALLVLPRSAPAPPPPPRPVPPLPSPSLLLSSVLAPLLRLPAAPPPARRQPPIRRRSRSPHRPRASRRRLRHRRRQWGPSQ